MFSGLLGYTIASLTKEAETMSGLSHSLGFMRIDMFCISNLIMLF